MNNSRFVSSDNRTFVSATVKFPDDVLSKIPEMSDYQLDWTWIDLPDGTSINYHSVKRFNGHSFVFEILEDDDFYKCSLMQSHRTGFNMHKKYLTDIKEYLMEEDWEYIIKTKAPVYLWNDDENKKVLGTLSMYRPEREQPFSFDCEGYDNCRLVRVDDLLQPIYIHGQLDLPSYDECGVTVQTR